jgi:hypothetical protein
MTDVRVNLKVEASGSGPAALRETANQAARGAVGMKALNDQTKAMNPAPVQQLAVANDRVASTADRAVASQRQLNTEASKTRPGAGAPTAGAPGQAPPRTAPTPPAPGGAAAPGAMKPEESALAKGYAETTAKLAVVGGTLAVLSKAAEGVSRAMVIHQDRHLSAAQKVRLMEESIPLFGDVAKARNALADALTGKAKEVQEIQITTAVNQQNVALVQQQAAIEAPLRIQQQQAKARADALAAAPRVEGPRRGDFADTLAGNQAFEDQRRLTQPRIDQRQAQAEARGSQAALEEQQRQQRAQEQRVREAADNANRLKAEAARLKLINPRAAAGQLTGPTVGAAIGSGGAGGIAGIGGAFGNIVGTQANAVRGAVPLAGSISDSKGETERLKVLGQVDAAVQKEKAERLKLLEVTKATGEAGKQAAEAESAARKANIAVQREELAILKEKEARIKSNAQAFGQLNEVEKQAAVTAAERLKTQGFESLTPEERGLIQQAGGGAALQQAAQQNALKDDRFKQFSDLVGQESDLKGTREAIADIEANVNLEVQVDTQKLQEQLTTALTAVLNDLVKQFEALIANTRRDVEVNLDIQNATR